MTAAHAKPYPKVLEGLRVDSFRGLTSQEVQKRLEEHGSNTFPTKHQLTPLQILFRQSRDPLIWVLIGAR